MNPDKHHEYPIGTLLIDYFPDAIAEVAHVAYTGSRQHNPDVPTHWDRAKSKDELNSMLRHLIKRGGRDHDGERHTAKMAWRALAMLQKELEAQEPQDTRTSAERFRDFINSNP